MKKVLHAYTYLFDILKKDTPFLLAVTVILSAVQGLCPPLLTWSMNRMIDQGILIAHKQMEISKLYPLLAVFGIVLLIPEAIQLFIQNFVQPRSQLVLRTSFRAKMMEKLKQLKYEHLENPAIMEVIDKAFNRTENAARILFPMYFHATVSSLIAVIGCFWLLGSVRWWLILTVLIPFLAEFHFKLGLNYDIYDKLETYWDMDYSNGILGKLLSTRESVKENKLNQVSDYLAEQYRERQNKRNREYEKYYLKHLKNILTSGNLARLSVIVNVLLLLWLYLENSISIGTLASLSLMIFNTVYMELDKTTYILRGGPYHANTFAFYEKFFALSEDEAENDAELPKTASIEFKNVWFRYPGTDRDILKGLSFRIEDGEKAAIVGENGEGKTTLIKLLLGLFSPDQGEILIGGVPIERLKSTEKLSKLYGVVFQDFMRYNISVRENIEAGDIGQRHSDEDLERVAAEAKADSIIEKLPEKWDTMLGRLFDGGVDLSGGQWQRIAMSRAFLGDKKILILDEPTSQLDPMSESQLYQDFAKLTKDKTTIFITHRLGSTAISDRILVVSDGKIAQSGTHEELMEVQGLYSEMFRAQKRWYKQEVSYEG